MSAARLVLLSLLVAVAGVMTVQAHEIGTTRVRATFSSDRTYRIEIATDAVSLLEKLDSAGTDDRKAGTADFASRLRAMDEIFRRRLQAVFDGEPVTPEIEYDVELSGDESGAATARIRLGGELPPRARHFAWRYGWTFTPYAFTLERPGAEPTTVWLEGGDSSGDIALDERAAGPRRRDVALQYLWLGFTHILPKGLDHVLFVLGIFLLSRSLRDVLCQVTAFTAAHSMTLALSLYGVVSVPSAFVEPLIALSIAYVAIENLFVRELSARRLALVFAFGLLHGLGFAGVLRGLGLPPSEIVTGLLAFNLGVEGGQLAVIGGAYLAIGWRCGGRAWYRERVVVPASLAIAGMAVYWTLARLPL